MQLTSVTGALMAVIKIFKRFCYLQHPSYYLTLGFIVLLSYCFRSFDAVPYLLLVGPRGTGKTLVLDILQLLCYRLYELKTSLKPACTTSLTRCGGLSSLMMPKT